MSRILLLGFLITVQFAMGHDEAARGREVEELPLVDHCYATLKCQPGGLGATLVSIDIDLCRNGARCTWGAVGQLVPTGRCGTSLIPKTVKDKKPCSK